ncbi:MAG: hypothetical protein QM808_17835 [Steroidobacteraceae bacterium]
MKLPNFLLNADLNALRITMGADQLGDLKLTSSGKQLTVAELEVLITGGIDIQSLDDIRALPDGTLAYKDRRVVLYIRDLAEYGATRSSMPKYHVSNCSTLQDMRTKNRFGRYVVAARQDGYFQINRISRGSKSATSFERLAICQNCLGNLSFDGFSRSWSSQERFLFAQTFKLDRFFSLYSRDLISSDGVEAEESAPMNDYSGDFGQHAYAAKERANWTCESCRRVLRDWSLRRFLHAHHLNALKFDNRSENLKALCIECHAKQPNHSHMLTLPQYLEFVELNIL